MTVEEIEILVTAKVEEALKEFEKFLPAIKQVMKQTQEAFSRVDTKPMTNKLHQAVNFMKKKVQDLKKSSEKNEIAIKVNNKDAQKQISQIQKEIDSLQKKITGRQLKLDVINPQIDKIVTDTRTNVTPEGIAPNDKTMDKTVDNALKSNKDFTNLNAQAQKLYTEIEMYNKQLEQAKSKMVQLEQETNKTATTQSKLSSFFSGFKQKIEQAKPSVSNLKNSFKSLPKITQNITNNIKGMGSGVKSGLGHVLKYAMALFSLRGIYSVLSNCAQSWLSSQNAGAKQLSANIEYMKYAMGSALAPIIQFVTNLVYQLMKAVQSVTYALTGVNIFAKASASSYASMAGNAKKAKQETKALAGVHNEINNISDNNNSDSGSGGSTSPSFDLSKMDNTPNSIIDAIKNGDWYQVGATIGEKLNEAMNNIPWDKIQNTAKNIGTNIAQFLNGFIATTDWKQVGNTVAQGINTAIYFVQSFVHTFNWAGLGSAVANTINGFFKNTDWGSLGDTISTSIKGIFNGITTFFKEFDWSLVIQGLIDFCKNVDWNGIVDSMLEMLGSACASFVNLGMIIGEKINEAMDNAKEYFKEKIEECGGNVVLGIFNGIGDAIANIGQWINDHIFQPFIDGFKSAFGIHSPSTVMEEQGHFIIEGLKNGLLGIWDKVKQPFINFKNNVINKFTEIKNNISNWTENTKATISNWGSNVKTKVSECWTNASNTVREKITTLRNNISTGLNTAKTTVSNWGSNIKNTFTNLGRNASTWGKDLVTNMATGIKNNIHKVTNAVTSVADKIKSFLHFTEPDEGPLSNFHTYMPDMIDLMVSGIKTNTNKIKNEMENLAGTMSYTINTEAVTGIPSTNPTIRPINAQSNNIVDALNDVMAYRENEGNKPIYLTVNVGNTKIGQILLDNLRDMKRQSGKDIEALVGG